MSSKRRRVAEAGEAGGGGEAAREQPGGQPAAKLQRGKVRTFKSTAWFETRPLSPDQLERLAQAVPDEGDKDGKKAAKKQLKGHSGRWESSAGVEILDSRVVLKVDKDDPAVKGCWVVLVDRQRLVLPGPCWVKQRLKCATHVTPFHDIFLRLKAQGIIPATATALVLLGSDMVICPQKGPELLGSLGVALQRRAARSGGGAGAGR